MLLNVGLSGPKATNQDYDGLFDWITGADNNVALENMVAENYGDINNNDLLSVNFNNASNHSINDILNEMRIDAPIQNDFLNDLLSDEPINNSPQLDNGGLENFNSNNNEPDNTFNEQNAANITNDTNDYNWLDQLLLNPESCSIPDVQEDLNDPILFEYDASEQINWEPNISLPNIEESDSETVTVQFNNGFNIDVAITNEYMRYETTPVQVALQNNTNEKHPCSTVLPMMLAELYIDIKNYLKNERMHFYGFLSEFAAMFRELVHVKDDDEVNVNHDKQKLAEYVGEQDQHVQNPNDSFRGPDITVKQSNKDEVYKCNNCLCSACSLHGLGVHMRMHTAKRFKCNNCKFTTSKEYTLKRHEKSTHGKAYICQMCNFLTHSGSKMRSHMRKQH